MILHWEQGHQYLLSVILRSSAGGGALVPVPATARGNIDYDQIRVAARTGNGAQLLTWNTLAPITSASTGTAGQTAYDGSGNYYWCYSANQWARIGPAGYSNSF